MTGESTSLFKVFRVLWFPMSINAMVLGAGAIGLFWLGTWAGAAALLDFPEGMDASDSATGIALGFGSAALNAFRNFTWPEGDAGWLLAWQSVLAVFLWATFGVAICRVLALRVARDEYCALGTAFSFAWRVKTAALLYPVAVALPLFFLLACNQLAGMVTSIPWLGWLVGGLLMPLTIISSILAVLIGIAAVVSVGFMPAAIATERKGTYDSLGKAFNYVFARPIPLILHLLVLSTFIGLIHDLFVQQRVVEQILGRSMTPWLYGDESFQASFRAMLTGETEQLSGFQGICAWVFSVVHTSYRLLLWGAIVAFVFGAFTSLFLILRRDVDGMDYSDVARDPAEAPDAAPSTPPAGDEEQAAN